MNYTNFKFNGVDYQFAYYSNDPSGLGCVFEIVEKNEYMLDNFTGHSGKFFIDIGCNCGVATIILAKQNPNSIVLSFDPDEKVYELVKKNIELNGISNVKLHRMGVSGNGVKELTLVKHPLYSGGNTTYGDNENMSKFFNNKVIETSVVPCISLDEIFELYKIDEVKLLKIDCEGAEYDILYSSNMFKNKKILNIVGEFHNLVYNNKVDKNDNKNNAETLLNYCKDIVLGICKISILNI